jgi:hypothetical protein
MPRIGGSSLSSPSTLHEDTRRPNRPKQDELFRSAEPFDSIREAIDTGRLEVILVAAGDAVVFRDGPAPTRADIAAVATRVEKRRRRWLRRRGLLDERAAEDRSNETPELSPLEACMQLSLFGSTYVRLTGDGAAVPLAGEEARFRPAGKGPWVADASGFNVHAGVTVSSGDREGLERLCRYCARPK